AAHCGCAGGVRPAGSGFRHLDPYGTPLPCRIRRPDSSRFEAIVLMSRGFESPAAAIPDRLRLDLRPFRSRRDSAPELPGLGSLRISRDPALQPSEPGGTQPRIPPGSRSFGPEEIQPRVPSDPWPFDPGSLRAHGTP